LTSGKTGKIVFAFRIRILSVGTLLIAALAVGCGGDDDDGFVSPSPTREPSVPAVTPFPAPTVVGQMLTSPAKGFSIVFPDGWTINPGYGGTIGTESIDVAFLEDAAATPVGQVRPSLVVGCIPVDVIPDPEAYPEQRSTALQSTLETPGEVRELQVANAPAIAVTYEKEIARETGSEERIRQTDVFFVTPYCGFTVSLLSAPEDAARFDPQFEAMLDSFQLIAAN
jgi:hypothetical protein